MQHNSNLQIEKSEIQSSAVLTPELIHPNFFKINKTCSQAGFKKKYDVPQARLSDFERSYRKRWAERQLSYIEHMPSTAVLGG